MFNGFKDSVMGLGQKIFVLNPKHNEDYIEETAGEYKKIPEFDPTEALDSVSPTMEHTFEKVHIVPFDTIYPNDCKATKIEKGAAEVEGVEKEKVDGDKKKEVKFDEHISELEPESGTVFTSAESSLESVDQSNPDAPNLMKSASNEEIDKICEKIGEVKKLCDKTDGLLRASNDKNFFGETKENEKPVDDEKAQASPGESTLEHLNHSRHDAADFLKSSSTEAMGTVCEKLGEVKKLCDKTDEHEKLRVARETAESDETKANDRHHDVAASDATGKAHEGESTLEHLNHSRHDAANFLRSSSTEAMDTICEKIVEVKKLCDKTDEHETLRVAREQIDHEKGKA